MKFPIYFLTILFSGISLTALQGQPGDQDYKNLPRAGELNLPDPSIAIGSRVPSLPPLTISMTPTAENLVTDNLNPPGDRNPVKIVDGKVVRASQNLSPAPNKNSPSLKFNDYGTNPYAARQVNHNQLSETEEPIVTAGSHRVWQPNAQSIQRSEPQPILQGPIESESFQPKSEFNQYPIKNFTPYYTTGRAVIGTQDQDQEEVFGEREAAQNLDAGLQGNQDTEPRPLPTQNGSDPTEIPVPPKDPFQQVDQGDSKPIQPLPGDDSSAEQPNDGAGDVEKRERFVYPNAAVPGRQTYPGATSEFDPGTEPGDAIPMKTNQIIYGPSEQPESVPQSIYQPVYPPTQGQALPQYAPIQPGQSFDSYEPVEPVQELAAPTFENGFGCPTDCGSAECWQPQMVRGWNEADPCSPCFEPMFYLSMFGGFTGLDDLEGDLALSAGRVLDIHMDDGFGVGAAIGQYQGYNLRTELEYTFRSNGANSGFLRSSGVTIPLPLLVDGDVTAHSGMANAIWQFSNYPSRFVKPYIGAGVGFAFVDANICTSNQDLFLSGKTGGSTFAYQFMAGLNTQLSPTTDFFVEYRYFAADSLLLEADTSVIGGTSRVESDYDYVADNVFFGVRFKF